jgi:dihydrofolate reductase
MIRLIAAIDQKRGIAKNGRQPWRLPGDERYFKDQTARFGAKVLMGHTTFDVIRRPLPDRTNYVLSHDRLGSTGIVRVTDLDEFLQSSAEDIWVIGGAAVYEQTIRLADELYLTLIASDFGCDQFFPDYEQKFELVSQSPLQHEAGASYSYAIYRRR